ncbi:site-2 protease family protein [Pontibacillus salipaludis]|uniref:site-2 protease family protein n=1 Tax=Pontibacillus salipaludis TaxID=1697394 RepID=UPI0031EA645F
MVVFAWFVFIVAPFCLLLHELGHSLLARTAGAERVEVFLGSGPSLKIQVNPSYRIHIGLWYFLGAMVSYDKREGFYPGDRIAISLGGPLFSLGGAVISWGIYLYAPYPIISFMMVFNCWLFIINLIPFSIRGKQSDGYLVMKDAASLIKDKWY